MEFAHLSRLASAWLLPTALAALAALSAQAAPVEPNPNSPLKTRKVLVLSNDADQGHAPAKSASLSHLQALAAKVPFSMTVGNPLTLTDAGLAAYDIIVFNYFFETEAAGVFPEASKTAFMNWLKKPGKGWLGFHNSGANEYAKNEWTWYQDNVTGMRYALHGSGTPEGIMTKTTDAAVLAAPIMEGLPDTYTAQDEWYDYLPESKLFTDGSKVMYYLSNAAAMTPPRLPNPIHPVAWFRQDANKTRYFYTPFGHTQAAVNSDWFKSIVLRALEYVSGDPVSIALTSATRSNLLSGTPAWLAKGQALPIDIPGKYIVTVWSQNGRRLASVSGSDKGTYILAPFAKSGSYIVTISSQAAPISHRISIY